MSLRELGRPKEAVDCYLTAIACSPDLAEAHLLLGEVLLDVGQQAEARTALELAARLSHSYDARLRAALARLRKSE